MLRPGGRLAVLEVDAPTLARSGAPATTSGSPRRCPCSAAPSRTARPTATCPGPWPTCPPRAEPAPDAASTPASPPSASGPWPGGLSQLVRGHPRRRRRRDAPAARTPRTVPLEYGPDALQFDGSPTVLFDRPGLTLVGWGTAQLVEAAEAAAALAAIPCDDPVAPPRLGRRGAGRAPLRRRHGRAARHPALHHGDRARRRRRHPALGHRGRAGGRWRSPGPTSSSTP